MGTMALQFIFSLFSFVGVIGILFYLILAKVKHDEQQDSVTFLESKVLKMQNRIEELEEKLKVKEEVPQEENLKRKIIALYEEGKDVVTIEESLNIPRAKIEMVLKFHNLKKADNWRKSVN